MKSLFTSQFLLPLTLAAAIPVQRAAKKEFWQPAVGTPFHMVLTNVVSPPSDISTLIPDVPIWDVDLLTTPDRVITQLKDIGRKKVICYFSAGTAEDKRADYKQFRKIDLGEIYPEWPEERWVKVDSPSVWRIMKARIELAARKGCDAIDPDNIDGFENPGGKAMGWTPTSAAEYLKKIAAEAAIHGMSTGLKNALPILPEVQDYVQFAVNEECSQSVDAAHACNKYWDFLDVQHKPVFHVEYPLGKGDVPVGNSSDTPAFCLDNDQPHKMKFSTLIGDKHLTGVGKFCGSPAFNTTVVEGSE